MDQTVEEAVGIEDLEPKGEEVPLHRPAPFGLPTGISFLRLQEPEPSQVFSEPLKRLGSDRGPEPFFHPLPDDIEWGRAVELLGDKVFGLPQTKEPTGRGIFDD